jgi:DNA-binding LytR/AlgR family response regulator
MPRNQAEIEERMEILCVEMEELLSELSLAQNEHARLDIQRRVAFATARVRARANIVAGRRPTIDAVDDIATIAIGDVYHQALVASGRITTAKEALRAKQSELDTLRSILVSHRNIAI